MESRLTPNHDVLPPPGLFAELLRPSAFHFLLLQEKQSHMFLLNATFLQPYSKKEIIAKVRTPVGVF